MKKTFSMVVIASFFMTGCAQCVLNETINNDIYKKAIVKIITDRENETYTINRNIEDYNKEIK